jgi:heme exporter protein A
MYSASTPLLEVRGLSCERDGRLLFDNLAFSLRPGEVLRIGGANGSGKTTLLRALAGLSERCRGEMLWRGSALRAVQHEFLSQSLYIGHEPGIKSSLSAVENLTWHCALNAPDHGGAIVTALARLGLDDAMDVPTRQLSAGQRRRVGLARLLLSPAILWILDEPFTAIDAAGVRQIESLIAEFVDGGGMVMLTTHHALDIARPYATVELGQTAGQAA